MAVDVPPAGTRPLLDAREVEVDLDGTKILKGASLQVREGEVHVLIGPNGARKTTFANAVTGHAPLAGGTIELRGKALDGAVFERIRSGIGRKFQVPRVFSRLSVDANLTVARRAAKMGERREDVQLAVQAAGGSPADGLSHGQRQRLELDMVLTQGPALAVLDEPTAGMTRDERAELAQLIRGAAGRETFLIVEHDMEFVETVADTVSFMQDGRVLATGTYDEISADEAVRSVYLGSAQRRAPRTERLGDAGTAGHGGPGSLQVSGLTVHRGRLAAVRDISFELPAGGSIGVLGRNGAGKTTLLEGLMGVLATSGSVRLDGEPVDHQPAWWRARRGMALVPQGRQLFGNLTVGDNLRLGEMAGRGQGRQFDIHALFPAIRGLMDRRAGLLSGGEQQQVAIARALLRRPTVLLLDEPTEGLSPIIVQEITRVLEHLVEQGLTILLAEQDRSIVEDLCESFVMLRSGESAGGGRLGSGAIERFYDRL
ncbi:MAG: branched-chain amino acid transport system ATP-binding protein livF [Solirubrobacteraceae bacterium]|nr:branched-chain amino acid transport system ATP-binding protein livF [Solirubrobacteraceae bacterium]